MPAVSTILRRYLPSYGTVKTRLSAAIHPVALPSAVKDITRGDFPRKESSDTSSEGRSSRGNTASGDEVREAQRMKRVTKISQDVEKQYPIEEDEAYLMDDLGPCRSQHSTPANSVKQDKIGFAC